MKSRKTEGVVLAAVLMMGCLTAEAALITFTNVDERGGGGSDENDVALTVTGFGTSNLGTVSGTHTQTLTVANIDFSTGLVGGTDSFSFDVVQSTVVGSVQFRNTSGGAVLSTGYEPWTISIQNIQILSGTGTVEFDGMKDVVITTFFTDALGAVDVYAGTDTTGDLLSSAGGEGSSRVSAATGNSSITLDYELNGGLAPTAPIYTRGIGFTMDVIPEPATLGMLGLGGLIVMVVRHRFKN